MFNSYAKGSEGFANESQANQQDHLVRSLNTSSGRSTINKKIEKKPGIKKEALLTSSTSELVGFYWLNRKRFSGGYVGFPVEVK